MTGVMVDGDVRLAAVLSALEALGFATVELEGTRIVDASPQFCELVGYSLEELRALPDVGPVFPPSQRALALEHLRTSMSGDIGFPTTAVLMRRDGIPVEVSTAGRPLTTDPPRRWLALVRDARDEARQRVQLAAYAEVLQRMPMGMLLWRVEDLEDPSSARVVAANRAATAGSGLRPAEVLGRTAGELFGMTSGLARPDLILEAHRTRQIRDLGEVHIADTEGPFAPGIYRRAMIPLPGDLVASLIENVTSRREADRHRRDLLQRILEAGGEERRRVAVGLHDDVIQVLAASLLDIEAAKRQPDDAAVDGAYKVVEERLRAVIARLRALVFELLPPELEEGLAAGVDVAAEKTFAGTGTRVETVFDLEVEPDVETRAMAYQIVAEGLTNARRHAEASTVTIELRSDDRWLVGVVHDDGKGAEELVTPPGHLGLRTMRERAELLGGHCSIRSTPGGGTTVEFRVPTHAAGS